MKPPLLISNQAGNKVCILTSTVPKGSNISSRLTHLQNQIIPVFIFYFVVEADWIWRSDMTVSLAVPRL